MGKEVHVGKARKCEGSSLEEQVKLLTRKKHPKYVIPAFSDQILEDLQNMGYVEYDIIGDELWFIQDEEVNDFQKVSSNPDGSVDYVLVFHNGGTFFSEAFESALHTLGKNRG